MDVGQEGCDSGFLPFARDLSDAGMVVSPGGRLIVVEIRPYEGTALQLRVASISSMADGGI